MDFLLRLTTMMLSAFPGSNLSMYNGAKGGTTSSYMALCLHVGVGLKGIRLNRLTCLSANINIMNNYSYGELRTKMVTLYPFRLLFIRSTSLRIWMWFLSSTRSMIHPGLRCQRGNMQGLILNASPGDQRMAEVWGVIAGKDGQSFHCVLNASIHNSFLSPPL